MNYQGQIVIVDDDEDDQLMYKDIFTELGYPNEIILFSEPDAAYDHLIAAAEPPFLIISDIRFPKTDGLDLKRKLLANSKLNGASIPFVFFTTIENKKIVEDAFKIAVQGFFIKDHSLSELKETIQTIMSYWSKSITPATA